MTKDELIDCPACEFARRHDPEGTMRGPCGLCGGTGKVRRGEWSEHMPDWDGRAETAPTVDAAPGPFGANGPWWYRGGPSR